MSNDRILFDDGTDENAVVAHDKPLPVYAAVPPAASSGGPTGYETVAAGQTAQPLGATGAAGDYLSHVILQPTAAGAGTTTILDNNTAVFTYTAGVLADLRPIIVPIGAYSVLGAWKITTGANMLAIGVGKFT